LNYWCPVTAVKCNSCYTIAIPKGFLWRIIWYW